MGASPYRLKDDPHSSHGIIVDRVTRATTAQQSTKTTSTARDSSTAHATREPRQRVACIALA